MDFVTGGETTREGEDLGCAADRKMIIKTAMSLKTLEKRPTNEKNSQSQNREWAQGYRRATDQSPTDICRCSETGRTKKPTAR